MFAIVILIQWFSLPLFGQALHPTAPQTAPIANLRPTQEFIGVDHAQSKGDNYREDYEEEWKKGADKNAKKEGIKFGKDYAEYVVKRMDEYVFPAILGPDGNYYITDGHHKIWSVFTELGKEYPELLKTAQVKVEVTDDFSKSGLSTADFYKKVFVDDKRGYFSPETKASITSDPEKFAETIKNFTGLKNDPMRSAVGRVFKKLGWSAQGMTDFVQFYVGKEMEKLGFKLPKPNSPLDKDNVEEAIDFILDHKGLITNLIRTAPAATRLEVGVMIEKSLDELEEDAKKDGKEKRAAKIRALSSPKYREAYKTLSEGVGTCSIQ